MGLAQWVTKVFGPRPDRPRRRIKDLGDHAENIRIERPEKPSGMSIRPSNATSYVEREFDLYGKEQLDKHQADGTAAARSSRVQAASLKLPAEMAQSRARDNYKRLLQTEADRDHAQHWLGPFARRAPGAHRMYLIWFSLLMLGDAVGVLGAALMWGEIWLLAIGQGLASGAAAVAAGWVGADVRDRRDANARAELAEHVDLPDDLTLRYPALFAPVPSERHSYGLTVAVAAVIAASLGSAIFALRAAVEGSLLAGLVFGGLALATCLASFVNSWAHADRVADLLERNEVAYREAEAQHERLIQHPAPTTREGTIQAADSIELEHLLRGAAAKAGVLALAEAVMRRHPEIFGHAVDPRTPSGPVGRRWLRAETSNGHRHLHSVPPTDDWQSSGEAPF